MKGIVEFLGAIEDGSWVRAILYPVSGKPMLSFDPFKIRSCGLLHGVDNELSGEYLAKMRYPRVDKDVQGKQSGPYRLATTVDVHVCIEKQGRNL